MVFVRALAVLAVVAATAAPSAGALAFNDYFTPPDGSQGTPYDFQFRARAGCDPVYYYSLLRGSLPPGLALSQSGRVSGRPTAPGVYQFTAQLESYYNGCTSYPSQRDFTIAIVPTRLAVAGVPYSVKFGSSGDATQTWSIASGQPPPGLTFSAEGMLSGTPTTAGSYSWSVRLGNASDTHQVTLEVDRPLVAARARPTTVEVGTRLSVKVAATGGKPPYRWVRTGGALPPGLTFRGTTIGGTPRAGGSATGRFTVTDALGQTATVTASFVVKPRLALERHRLPGARAGATYRARLRAQGGVGPFSWRTTGTLPPGIRLDRRSGLLTGVARSRGSFPLILGVEDALGRTSSARVILRVS
jgi:hypothetical protein